MRLKLLISFVFLSLLAISCEKQPEGKKEGGNGGKQEGRRQELTLTPVNELNAGTAQVNSHASLIGSSHLTPVAGTYVRLDNSVVVEEKPIYPRFTRTAAGDYLMFYHGGNDVTWAGNECSYLISEDMVQWSSYKKLFAGYRTPDYTGASNMRVYAGAHPLLLANGDVLVTAATRMLSNYQDRVPDNGLAIRISHDGGQSWDPEIMVMVGTCWEPIPIQLKSGRIQIYYTDTKKLNSTAFGTGVDVMSSGSSYIYSDDNGKTWLPANAANDHIRAFAQVRYKDATTTVMTDQMPAVIELNGSAKLAAAAESFIGNMDYTSYISLAYSDASGDWGTPDASGVIPESRNSNFIGGCAPYLVQFPSGETVLSYNANSTFYMRQGNENCRKFGDAIKVFAQTAATGKGFWGAMYVAGSHRMVAGVGGSGGVLQIGQFYLNHSVKASARTVNVDGNNTEWQITDEALYLCSLGDTKAIVRCAQDSDKLYFLFEVKDKEISKDDYVQLFLSDPSKQVLSGTSIRVKASYLGYKAGGVYAGGWIDQNVGAEVSASYDGTPALGGDEDKGYVVEVAVPRASLPIQDGKLLANFALFDTKNGGEDAVVSTAGKSTAEWISIYGL